MKTIAMYLPQFHSIPENDAWWGKGYTEWTAVRSAIPLFSDEAQPKKPLNNNYYNLLDRSTIEWQAQLAKRYKVDGFCFYHYWFGEERRILEKPAENLLRWTDIDMPFCFCWDTSTWARTWTKLGNSWADKFENNRTNEKNNGILIEQNFGGEKYWEKHFEYLLPFFRDKRYVCVDGKPVFVFFGAQSIPCLEHMCLYWRRLAKEYGLTGLYLIAHGQPNSAADATILPMAFSKQTIGYNLDAGKNIPGTSILGYDYDKVWQDYLATRPLVGQKTLWEGVVDFDDTPRRGQNGRVYLDCTVEKFERYFRSLYKKSLKQDNPFVFLDAWNEWGEGKYLEPDEQRRYGFLKAIHQVKNEPLQDSSVNDVEITPEFSRYIGRIEDQVVRCGRSYFCMMEWVRLGKEADKALQCYFDYNNLHTIAIYGFGNHGHMFYELVQKTSTKVVYAIDRQKYGMKQEAVPVYSNEDTLPTCDAIVVSLVNDYVQIATELRKKIKSPILSLYEVIAGAGECWRRRRFV